jgi:hypothetical protein
MAKKANLDVSDKLDITIRRGDSFELSLNIKDNEGNNIQLVTGDYNFFIQVKSVTSPSSALQTSVPRKTVIAGSSLTETTVTNSPTRKASTPIFSFVDRDDDGNVKLRAEAEDTAKLPVGSYVYDIQYKYLNNGFNTVTTLLRGSFIVKEDITTSV